MEVSYPVSLKVIGCSFMSDFVLLSVFLPFLSADDLRLVQLRSSWKNCGFDLLVKFCQSKAMERADDESRKHLEFSISKISNLSY